MRLQCMRDAMTQSNNDEEEEKKKKVMMMMLCLDQGLNKEAPEPGLDPCAGA